MSTFLSHLARHAISVAFLLAAGFCYVASIGPGLAWVLFFIGLLLEATFWSRVWPPKHCPEPPVSSV